MQTSDNIFIENPFTVLARRLNSIDRQLEELKGVIAQGSPIGPDPHERLSRKQIVSEYGISLTTVHNLMKSGQLSYEKVGRRTLFRRQDVEACFSGKK